LETTTALLPTEIDTTQENQKNTQPETEEEMITRLEMTCPLEEANQGLTMNEVCYTYDTNPITNTTKLI